MTNSWDCGRGRNRMLEKTA